MSKRKQLTFMLVGTALFLFMVTFMWLNYTGYIKLAAEEQIYQETHLTDMSKGATTIKVLGLTVAGATGGALVGAGVGSAVPGIGTGVGAFGGGIIGGIVGLVGSLAT